MSSNTRPDDENVEFNWIKMRKEVGLDDIPAFNDETGTEKFMRKFNENPLVPLGALLTATCLTLGLLSLKKGDPKMSQLMMRGRVLAQGFTLTAVVAGLCLKAASNLD